MGSLAAGPGWRMARLEDGGRVGEWELSVGKSAWGAFVGKLTGAPDGDNRGKLGVGGGVLVGKLSGVGVEVTRVNLVVAGVEAGHQPWET